MDTNHSVVDLATIVAFYDNRRLIAKTCDVRSCGNESRPPSSVQTEVLIEIVIVKSRYCWFQDMCRSSRPVRDTPAAVFVQQRRLCLGSSKAELSGKRFAEPGSGVGF
jgi:hypothetical protein